MHLANVDRCHKCRTYPRRLTMPFVAGTGKRRTSPKRSVAQAQVAGAAISWRIRITLISGFLEPATPSDLGANTLGAQSPTASCREVVEYAKAAYGRVDVLGITR
jgi:hypothetical protein